MELKYQDGRLMIYITKNTLQKTFHEDIWKLQCSEILSEKDTCS